MGFLIFIWNFCMRVLGIFGMILMETMVFSIVYYGLSINHPVIANFLAIVFIIWILLELILRVFVSGGVTAFKYLIGRFF